MIVQDFNKMSLEELMAIHDFFRINYILENGEITGTEKEEEHAE